ncbi:MAG: transporter substrate-binding domain-containing protein [Candidatus Sedimenticola sp. (ex Thyasira tokunagai)]
MNVKRLFYCFLVLGFLFSGSVAAAEKLYLNTGTRAPYTTEQQQGFLDLLITELFGRLGYEAEVPVYNASARALANANDGVDAGVAMRIAGLEKKYPNLIRIQEKLIDNDFVAYSLSKDIAVDGWASLKPYPVGYILGWQIFERNLPPDVDRTKVKDPQQLFFMLQMGRVNVALYERWQGLWRAKQLDLKVQIHEPPLAQVKMYIYLHKKYAHLVGPAAEALAEMKRDGTWDEIAEKTLRPLLPK